MKITFWLTMLFLTSGALVDLCAKTPGGKPPRKLKVVIDASRDGGAWWFPQGPPPFDSQKPHQGARLAAYLKSRGWEVIEIPRETKITSQFKGAAMVVRFNKWGGYQPSEVAAYREFVRKGGRLLLVQGFVKDSEGENDAVARSFGVRFEGVVETAVMRSAKGASLDYSDTVYRIGSVVNLYPRSTRLLARLDDDRVVIGMFGYGRGRIIFLSSVFSALQVPEPFISRLFDDLSRSGPGRSDRSKARRAGMQ